MKLRKKLRNLYPTKSLLFFLIVSLFFVILLLEIFLCDNKQSIIIQFLHGLF